MQSDPDHSTDLSEYRQFAMGAGRWIPPVVIIHLAAINGLVRIYTGYSLTSWLPTDRLVPWAWVNGGMFTIAAFAVRRGRWNVGAGALRGWRARMVAITWIALSAVWFCLPEILTAIRAIAIPTGNGGEW
ncbi:hypothetical protein [Sphingomonas sp. Leaf242]|uniref:hypothetical protein n=1 Tax=Sphingomonas sp. Leaf242 TaxID=1736304 RepID=UPI0007613008|nr:hypothetical protein [Sphingomonas sp. Leaf242]